MTAIEKTAGAIPAWSLYGEERSFPDVLHCEEVTARAAGLDWRIAPHRHHHLHQFFLIREGEVAMDADGRRIAPAPPCVISVPRNTVHGFVFAAGTDGLVVTLPVQNLPEVFDEGGAAFARLGAFAVAGADDGLVALFERLEREHDARRTGRAAMLKALAVELSCEVLRRLPPADDRPEGEGDAVFGAFEALVQRHFRDRWSVDDYARALKVSPRQLSRICHRAAGQSPVGLLQDAVMREACRMLVYTRAGVAGIGYQLGFEDPSYFSRAFRRHVGMTPKAYRAEFDRA